MEDLIFVAPADFLRHPLRWWSRGDSSSALRPPNARPSPPLWHLVSFLLHLGASHAPLRTCRDCLACCPAPARAEEQRYIMLDTSRTCARPMGGVFGVADASSCVGSYDPSKDGQGLQQDTDRHRRCRAALAAAASRAVRTARAAGASAASVRPPRVPVAPSAAPRTTLARSRRVASEEGQRLPGRWHAAATACRVAGEPECAWIARTAPAALRLYLLSACCMYVVRVPVFRLPRSDILYASGSVATCRVGCAASARLLHSASEYDSNECVFKHKSRLSRRARNYYTENSVHDCVWRARVLA